MLVEKNIQKFFFRKSKKLPSLEQTLYSKHKTTDLKLSPVENEIGKHSQIRQKTTPQL